MTRSLEERIAELLSNNTFAIFEETQENDVSCLICKQIMNNPYEAHCGCHFCYSCIVNYLNDGPKICLGKREDCSEADLILDKNVTKSAVLQRKVHNTIVICSIVTCTHYTELKNMVDHHQVCIKQRMKCPYCCIGCDFNEETKETIIIHIQNEALMHSQLMINELRGVSQSITLNILLERDDSTFKKIEDLQKEIQFLKNDNTQKQEIMDNTLKELTDCKEKTLVLENQCKEFNNKISILETKYDEFKKSNIDNQSAIQKLETTMNKVNRGTNTIVAIGEMTFTVNEFLANMKIRKQICSPYFYSHANGYKLRLITSTGENNDDKDPYLPICIQICDGEYDDVLIWPCRCNFFISVLDSNTGEERNKISLSYDTVADNFRALFFKPIKKDNDKCEYQKFISYKILQSYKDVVASDSVTFKCTVVGIK